MHTAKAAAATEMHAAKAMPSAMTAAEVSATAVTTATMSAASRQRCTRQHGGDNQNGNSNAGLRHAIAPASLSAPPHHELKRRWEEQKVPRAEVAQSHSRPF
jgi:hypothetical protein